MHPRSTAPRGSPRREVLNPARWDRGGTRAAAGGGRGVVVFLEDERWLDRAFVPEARSRGESWIVLGQPELEAAWLSARPEVGLSAPRPMAMVEEPAAVYETQRRGSRTVPL